MFSNNTEHIDMVININYTVIDLLFTLCAIFSISRKPRNMLFKKYKFIWQCIAFH